MRRYDRKWRSIIPEQMPSVDNIPSDLAETIDDLVYSKLMNALAIYNKTMLHGELMRNLLKDVDPEYAELHKVVDITVDDICKFADEHPELR